MTESLLLSVLVPTDLLYGGYIFFVPTVLVLIQIDIGNKLTVVLILLLVLVSYIWRYGSMQGIAGEQNV